VLGRDVTLTGRTMLWSAVLGRMFERPLLGYGYGASWVFVPGPGETVRAIVGWETPHSHNAFLDYSLDMGLFGLLVFLAALVRAARRSLVSLRFEPSGHRWWPITYLSLLLMGNITESGVYQSQFIWALFVAVSAAGTAVGGRTQRLGVL